MIIKKGDYTFCGEDTRPHRWALKIKDTLVQLDRLTWAQWVETAPYKSAEVPTPGQPTMYYVADDGLFATMYPPADQDYELVQLSN